MPHDKKILKLTSSKSGLATPPQKHQYKRTSSGTTIRGVNPQEQSHDVETPSFYLDPNGPRPNSMTPMTPSGSALPPALRVRLYELFVQIEKEFEALYVENIELQERVDWISSDQTQQTPQQHFQQLSMPQLQQHVRLRPSPENPDVPLTPTPSSATMTSLMNTVAANLPKGMSKGMYAHKIRSQTNKLRQQTNRIMSNLKGPSAFNSSYHKRYVGHKDGVWEVSVSRMGFPLIGTASADHTSIVWGMHSGRPLLQYTGHTGSVNSVRFHPNKELVLTASGDTTAHIWQCALHLFNETASGRLGSSEDELVDTPCAGPLDQMDSFVVDENKEDCAVLRTPLRALAGHTNVVIAADWLPTGDQVVTAGWDRLACVWDTNTGQLLQQLTGHDQELTHTSTHPFAKLVVTSSKDFTFRLWDFRESIHSVSVFQGHQDYVTSAVFTRDDQVASGSDDRSVRIWDLRNMRSPFASIHTDSAVNRISVNSSGLIAIPLDNRNVRLYDVNGQRMGRLPRSSRLGHSRMVCSAAWSDDTKPNLFTSGFDKATLGWDIQPRDNLKELDASSTSGGILNQSGGGAFGSGSGDQGARLSLGLRGTKDLLSLKEPPVIHSY